MYAFRRPHSAERPWTGAGRLRDNHRWTTATVGRGHLRFQLPNVGHSRDWLCTSLENERISVFLAQRDEVLDGSAYRGTEKHQIF